MISLLSANVRREPASIIVHMEFCITNEEGLIWPPFRVHSWIVRLRYKHHAMQIKSSTEYRTMAITA